MKLSDTAIQRPVLASMLSAALVLFGAISYTRLSVREFPDVDPPIISVSTTLPGANPQVVESAVTDPLEDELSTVPGLRTLSSSSAEEVSNITLEFTLDRNVEDAAQDVRDRVARVRGRLPEDVLEPVVSKQDADANPFFWMALSGANYSLLQLSDIGDRLVKTRLQSLPGVGQARIFGERRYSMRVWLSSRELAARGLTVQDVENAIRSRNVEIPAGRIESHRREFTVRSLGELKTPAEFGELTVVSPGGGGLVKLKDIGRVELGPENERTALRYKGTPAVAIGVIRQSKANLIEVADAIQHELPRIQRTLPPGVDLTVAFDQSVFVRRSIKEAEETLLVAGLLVVLIIFVFLRNLRATFIPGLAIPTSIVAAFAVMFALGFSINNLTLLALTLAIGIVVDDAIIVLENAYRHQEELGQAPDEAARRGTGEIAFAVIATTVSLVAVFTPLAFLRGSTGRLFNEFGIAVAGSVIISGFVALTLTPMLCAKILRVTPRHGRLYMTLERGFQGLANRYGVALRSALRHRWWVVGGTVAVTLAAGGVFMSLQREFVPPEDRGFFVTVVLAPEGASLDYTDSYQRQVEAVLAKTKDIEGYFSLVGLRGVNFGIIFSRLTDWDRRDRSVQDILAEVQPQLFRIPGVFAFANNPPAFGGFESPVQYVVQFADFDKLVQAMDTMVARARRIPGLINVDADLKVNKPELAVHFDRDRAEDLGVPVGDAAATLQTLLGGRRVSTFTRDNKLYDVIVRLEPEERATPHDISGLQVRGRGGELVQLSSVARVEEGVGAQRLIHFNRVRSFTLSGNLQPGFTLGQALDSLDALAAQVLPEGATTALSGESRELAESGGALYFAFALALLVVFMVLASQFESLVHPFTVLLAVPLAVTGAIFALKLMGSTINLYSQIGMILLIGLVVKNSILLVEFANQLRARGMDTAAAVLEAGRVRLRPILMTSFATIMGALPIALGLGAGSVSRRPLGYAIVGGILFSTLLTLFLVPVAYVLIEGLRLRVRGQERALHPVEAD